MFKEYMKKYEEDIKNCKNDWKNVKTWYKQIPNLLTLSRPIGMIPANILFFTGHEVLAIVLTAILLFTDFFDGKLARKWNVQSKFGADLDAVGDKITFLGMSLPLMISNPLLILNLILEAIIACINVYGRVKGLDTKTVFAGKIKMWFLSVTMGVGYLSQFLNMPSMILNLLICGTAGIQLVCVKDYWTEVLKMEQEAKKNNILDNQLTMSNEITSDEELELLNKIVRNSEDELKKEVVLTTLDTDKGYSGKKKS